ncbi:MAG: site-specific DNA-methyltransferase [Lachnospiraceae bacterium]|nr:MAG: site-specific DNA-methyltransferase [Lachnospiraceae bacterium]
MDPPYNNRNRSWKYNNDYVDDKDTYKHSKWLSFMKTRLLLARKLLNPDNSILIVTIDEKEYLHLGCLLEELFPEATIQMITSVISAKGVVRTGQFSRVEEYVFYVSLGKASVVQTRINMLDNEVKKEENRPIEWLGLRRREPSSKRGARPNQFYPIFVDENTGKIKMVGDALSDEIDRNNVSIPDGCVVIWPLDSHGIETLWGLTPEVLRNNLKSGYVRVKNWNKDKKTGTVYYLPTGTINDIESGKAKVSGYTDDGAVEAYYEEEGLVPPKRVWNMKSHNAETYGTNILSKLLPDRSFPYPKSLYAVMDMVCDWTPRRPENYLLSNVLCLHIKEMIELQNSIELDGKKNVLILNKDDIKSKILSKDSYKMIERIWLNQNIILNSEEMELLRAKGFKYIPREYFGQELREVAE